MVRILSTALLSWACLPKVTVVGNQYLDRFIYDDTVQRRDGYTDFGPSDWGDITCDEQNDLDGCIAYRDKWYTGQAWDIERNYCRWCPKDNSNCGRHHQSPIDLERDRGIPGHPNEKECIDVHWMKYEDSWCTQEHLEEANAFTVERHALRIAQPITVFDNEDEYRIDCLTEGKGRKFGRIDFSKGFSDWWFLSHIDFSVPSEHTQEGKRYSAEAQMYHFYSISGEAAGVDNEMGTVAVFMEAYDDAAPYLMLDKLICLWRRHEHETRTMCGMQPVETQYPGCFPENAAPINRKRRKERKRKLQQLSQQQFRTVHDLILHNSHAHEHGLNVSMPKLIMDDVNWSPPEDKDWDAFIKEQSDQFKAHDKRWEILHNQTNGNVDDDHYRKLIEGDELDWFNYFLMTGVRTEYYYRYSGTQTIPPCYGNFNGGSRAGTNHWRVLKDPIRINTRQLEEMKRLIKDRIAPFTDPVAACKSDTAAKVKENDGTVDVARPLQDFDVAHFEVFCECKDWPSKWPEDREWCNIDDYNERFYEQPYNFQTSGF